MVPEAKPLSLNEVRLTKDDDSESRKRERKHSLNNSYENQKNKDDRKTDAMDNYLSKYQFLSNNFFLKIQKSILEKNSI